MERRDIERSGGASRTPAESVVPPRLVYALTGICHVGYTKRRGVSVRNHRGAEPPRDLEPPGLVTTVGWRDRARASDAAADRVKAPASAARGRLRRIHGGRT